MRVAVAVNVMVLVGVSVLVTVTVMVRVMVTVMVIVAVRVMVTVGVKVEVAVEVSECQKRKVGVYDGVGKRNMDVGIDATDVLVVVARGMNKRRKNGTRVGVCSVIAADAAVPTWGARGGPNSWSLIAVERKTCGSASRSTPVNGMGFPLAAAWIP